MHSTGRIWGRAFGFLFLTALVGAIALLIAGYGVVVGLGALAGLILGSVAGMLSVMWLMRGFGRSVNFGSMDWSSESELRSGPPSDELLAEMREVGELSSIDLGPIRAVRPVLETAEAGGLIVQLVAIEEHEAGSAMTFDVRARPGAFRSASWVRAVVTDDAGTDYRAAGNGQGGDMSGMRYQVSVIPATPPAATRLDIRIERFFDPFPRGSRVAVGPWEFSVSLGPPRL
jgi:hypothetical protein